MMFFSPSQWVKGPDYKTPEDRIRKLEMYVGDLSLTIGDLRHEIKLLKELTSGLAITKSLDAQLEAAAEYYAKIKKEVQREYTVTCVDL